MGQREDLEHMREVLLRALNDAEDSVKAQIAGQLRAVIKDLASLAGSSEVSKADEIASRRSARRGRAADSAPTSRRGQSRRRGGGSRAR